MNGMNGMKRNESGNREKWPFPRLEAAAVRVWLGAVQQLQRRLIGERGYFPDSTPDIAADRVRDE
jgi:hypothetical protein